jgi:O-antigen/teichoic acid export membrane protein
MFVRYLGAESYGVFSLVSVVGSVNTFANLGLNSSLVRFLSRQGKTSESDHDILVSLIILMAVLSPLTVCGIVYRQSILVDILVVPTRLLVDAQWLLVAMLISNVFVLLGHQFTAILDAQQKVYLTNLYQLFYNGMYSGLILLVLLIGYSLKAIALVIVASTALWFCVVFTSSIRSWGGLTFAGLGSNGMRVARKHLSYGMQIYAGGLINFLFEPLTKLLAARFLGVTEVGLFDIGIRARNLIYNFAAKLLYPLYPIISKLDDRESIRTLVHDVEQKTILIIIPLIAIVILTVKPLTLFFFNTNADAIATTVAWMIVAFLLGSITVTPNFHFLTAKGHASKTVILHAVNGVVNAIVFMICLPWLGYYAVVVANATAILSSGGLCVYYQKRYLNSLIFDSAKQAFAVFIVFLVAMSLGCLFSTLTHSGVFRVILIPIVVLFSASLMYRYLSLVKATDVIRYLGDGNVFSKLSVRILCKAPNKV